MKHNSLLFISVIILYIFVALLFLRLIIFDPSLNKELECGPPIIKMSYEHASR